MEYRLLNKRNVKLFNKEKLYEYDIILYTNNYVMPKNNINPLNIFWGALNICRQPPVSQSGLGYFKE